MNTKAILSGVIALTLILSVVPTTLAATFRTEEEAAITITEPVSDELYAFGNDISIAAPVTGDVVAGGRSVVITEPVSQDVFAGAQTISVESEIGDDIHLAGELVTFAGSVLGDGFMAGNSIVVSEEATVGEDLYTAGATTTIAGQVQGDVRAAGEKVTIKRTARIAGNLKVISNQDPVIEDGAVIEGEFTHVRNEMYRESRPAFQSNLGSWVYQVISLFVVALLLFLMFPRPTQNILTSMQAAPLKRFGMGLLWILLFIPAVIFFFITVIGWPIALLIVAGTGISFILATALAALFIGQWLMQKTSSTPTTNLTWTHALLGAVAYQTIQLIPIVGGLITCVLVLIALGSIAVSVWPKREAASTTAL